MDSKEISQMKRYFEIKRAQQIIDSNHQSLDFDYIVLDEYILENFNDLEQYILEEFYFNKNSLKLIAYEKGMSYSYVRQVIHFSRKKIITFVSTQIN